MPAFVGKRVFFSWRHVHDLYCYKYALCMVFSKKRTGVNFISIKEHSLHCRLILSCTMEKSSRSNALSQAFFKGEIKDKTTKESRKAAESLALLKTIKKNPSWKPVDTKSKLLKKTSSQLSSSYLAKMRMQIGDTVPDEVVSSITQDIAGPSSASCSSPLPSSSSSAAAHSMDRQGKNPMLLDVEAEIHRRIHALGKSGKMFEENAPYIQDQQLAADAEFLVRGIDPQASFCIVDFTYLLVHI